jgi:phage terminase small subunit
MPDDLAADAVKVWNRVMAATAHTAHIGPGHAETFRQYCEATAALNAWKPKGTKEWRELANLHRQLARELCLTPATGANLTSRRTEPERKLARYTA